MTIDRERAAFSNALRPVPAQQTTHAGQAPAEGAVCAAAGRPGLLALLGLTAGFLSGFLGIGGGLVIVPVLIVAFHYPIKRAVGTSLAAIVFVSLAGILTEVVVQRSNIYLVIGLLLTVASLLGSLAGGRILPRLPDAPLRLAFTAFLVFASYRMWAAAQGGAGLGQLTLAGGHGVGYLVAFAVGGLAGLSSILFGLGGGIVMVPALSLLFGDIPFHAARATALVQILPTAGFGAYQHRGMGTVDVSAARGLIPTGLAGAILGVVSVNHLPARPCQLFFAAFLVLAAARLLIQRRAGTHAAGAARRADGDAPGGRPSSINGRTFHPRSPSPAYPAPSPRLRRPAGPAPMGS